MPVRVAIPFHLQTLAKVNGEVLLNVQPPVTIGSVLQALEAAYPMLKGTVRDHATGKRRPYLRFYACSKDFSHEGMECELPAEIADGKEVFIVLGAISGG
ncbi:MAG TPA: MoaD/ThiS family protein [Pyrinomonadaceae bacterium]|jgi:hypothetical protein|nr:MoaD/ThiS family protein [Pyrinomonadaceae bacterium]